MATNLLSLLAKLPDGVLFENIDQIEVKVTLKEGDELSGHPCLEDCEEDYDHKTSQEVRKTICVELLSTHDFLSMCHRKPGSETVAT